MPFFSETGTAIFRSIRRTRPLIHLITNPVTMNDVVNLVLASGATAICADSPKEAAEISGLADATVLNIGMPSESKAEAMLAAGEKANELGHPLILDPVGAGASDFRQRILKTLLERLSGFISPASAAISRKWPPCSESLILPAAWRKPEFVWSLTVCRSCRSDTIQSLPSPVKRISPSAKTGFWSVIPGRLFRRGSPGAAVCCQGYSRPLWPDRRHRLRVRRSASATHRESPRLSMKR